MAAIKHPHVAQVILPHGSEQGYDFCVLEYVEGRPLNAEIRTGRMTVVGDILRVLLDVGTGLAEVHATGVIHGDVSPKNILVYQKNGRPHASLVDFDLVCAMEEDLMTVAATGMPGTDPYAAPEWKARRGGFDGRVDVFGLGMTAVYALVRGTLPPSLNDPEAMDPAIYIARKLSAVDPSLRRVLIKACSLVPENRHATMMEFCIELRRAGGAGPLSAAPLSAPHEVRAEYNGVSVDAVVMSLPGSTSGGAPLVEKLTAEKRSWHAFDVMLIIGVMGVAIFFAWMYIAPVSRDDVGASARVDVLPMLGHAARGISRARIASRDLGLQNVEEVLSELWQLTRGAGLSSIERQLMTSSEELIHLRVIACQIAVTVEPLALGGLAQEQIDSYLASTVSFDEMKKRAVEGKQWRRVLVLAALAQNVPLGDLLLEDDELIAVVRAAPLWRGTVQTPPPGLVSSLQQIADPSTLGQSILALALWRSGDVEAAHALLRRIVVRVKDQPAALAMLEVIDRQGLLADDGDPAEVVVPVQREPLIDSSSLVEIKVSVGCQRVREGSLDGVRILEDVNRRVLDSRQMFNLRFCIAVGLTRVGEDEQALIWYREALEIVPRDRDSIVGAARAAERLKQMALADELYDRLDAIDSDHPALVAYRFRGGGAENVLNSEEDAPTTKVVVPTKANKSRHRARP